MTRLLLALPLLLATLPAHAHHAMDGKLPYSFATGLLSGLAHPVIGLDHLAFLVAAGLLSLAHRRWLLVLPLAFMLASLAGTLLHIQEYDLPGGEALVALSVIAFAALLLWSRVLPVALFALLLSFAGLFHGYAFGESIVGAETAPLTGYLIGLGLIQYALTAGIALGFLRFAPARPILLQRAAGLVAGLVGLGFFASQMAG
ncbi:HupE/UreJ family protein [Ferrovibrio sp. MS7]|uniref:HupE/UreJ family protein n=1 Tax=Ferrovibrio plantarum TaxID=3119164 RepID=UPI0031366421